MASSQTFTFNIKAVADMKDVTDNIQNIQSALGKLKLPDNLKTSFSKNFGDLQKELDKYQRLMAGGVKTKGDANALEKSGNNILHLYDKIAQAINSLDGSTLKKAFEDLGGKEVENLKNQITDLQNQLKQQVSTQSFINVGEAKKGLAALKGELKGLSADAEKVWGTLSKSTFNTFAKNLQDGRLDLAASNLEKIGRQVQEINNVDLTKWYIQLEESFAKLQDSSGISNTTQQIEQLKASLANVKADAIQRLIQEFKNGGKSVDQFNRELINFVGGCNQAGQATAQMNSEIDQVKNRIQYFFGLNNAINLVKRGIRSAINTIKELDKAMTATAVVTDFSVSDMWAQLPEYTKRANELGVTTQAAYEAATLYYQQGLNNNEVNALSVETLKMARIAGLDAAEATDRMTNALRGFNMEITKANAQRVDDVYSELAANTASNVDEISTAMTKVASLAHNANMEFETTSAFLAQIIETTRESAETAGTALKTVVARFSEVKKLVSEGALTGEDEEGEVIDVNKVSVALRTAGIDLNKYFLGEVGLDDIFMELASKWDKLTALQQRYIATQAAGSRQQSRFIAMMSDYARTQELVSKAYDSNGASERQFEKTQDSLESKLARLKNAWNEFLMGLTNSTMVKTFVDLLTNFLNTINKLTSAFDAGTNTILKWGMALGGIFGGKALFDSAGFKKILKGLTSLGAGQITEEAKQLESSGLAKAIEGLTKDITKKGSSFVFLNLSGAIEKVGESITKIGTAIKGLWAVTWPFLAIIGATIGFAALTKYNLNKEAEMKDPSIKLKKQADTTKEYADSMDQLSTKTAEASDNIQTIQSQSISNIDAINNAETDKERREAIQAQNDYISQLLKQGAISSAWVEAIDDLDGQIILTLDDEKLAEAANKAAEAAVNASVAARMAHVQSYSAENALLDEQIRQLENKYIEENGKYYRKTEDSFSVTPYGVYVIPGIKEEISKEEYLNAMGQIADYQGQQGANNQQIREYATQAFKEIASVTIDKDNIDLVSNLLGGTLNTQEYSDRVAEEITTLINQSTDKTEAGIEKYLRDKYFKTYGVEAETGMSSPEMARQIAQTVAQADWGTQISNLNNLINTDDQIKTLAQAFSGEIELSKDDLAAILPMVDKLADTLGVEVKDVLKGVFKSQEALAKRRGTAVNSYDQQLLLAGAVGGSEYFNGIIDKVSNLPIENLLLLNQTARDLQNIVPPDQYIQFLESLPDVAQNNIEALREIALFSQSFNLDNPIKAVQQLENAMDRAEKLGDKDFIGFLENIQKISKESFTDSSLFKSFVSSESYDGLTKSITKLIKKNGQLTAENIEELAESCEDLQFLLDETGNSAEGLANALTLLNKGDVPLEAFNDELLKILANAPSVEKEIKSLHDWISNFDKGTDYGEPSEFFVGLKDELAELAKGYEFGNERTINLYEAFFGKGSYKKMYDKWIKDHKGDFNPEKFRQFVMGQVNQAAGQVDNNSYKFMDTMANGKSVAAKKLGIKQDKKNKYNFEWNIGNRDTDALIKDIQEAYKAENGEKIGREYAMALLEGWLAQSPDAKFKLAENDFHKTLRDLAKDSETVTEDQLKAIEELYGQSEGAAKKYLASLKKDGKKIPIVLELTDKNGNPIKDPKQLYEEAKKVLDKTAITSKTNINGETVEGIDAQSAIKSLQESGFSEEQARVAVNQTATESGNQLIQQVRRYDAASKKFVDDWISGQNLDDLEEQAKIIEETNENLLKKEQIIDPLIADFGTTLQDAINGLDWTSAAQAFGQEVAQAIQDYLQPKEQAQKRAQEMSEGGNVDLNNRPRVSAESMQRAGYEEVNAPATVYTHTFSGRRDADNASMAINVTPILPDGRILTEDALKKYANEMIQTGNDPLQLRIGPEFIGNSPEEAIQQAEQAAEQIHLDQDVLYEDVDSIETSDIIDEEGLSTAIADAGNDGGSSIGSSVSSALQQAWSAFKTWVISNPITVPATLSPGGGTAALGGIVRSWASGSSYPVAPGFALTGEEGPEIVWNKYGGYAYVTGKKGPEFQNLQPGDRIFNAAETKRIFRNSSFAKGGVFRSYGEDPSKTSGAYNAKLLSTKKKKPGESSDKKGKQSTWRNELDWLYDLMEDIAEYERKQTIIQAQYDLYLKDINKKGSDLFKLTQKELTNLKTQLKAQETAQSKRLQEMKELQKQVNNAGYGKYIKYNQKDQTLEINWDAIEKIQDKDTYDKVTEWLSRMEDVQDKMDDAEDALLDIKSQIQQLQERYLQQYLDFQTKVMDALVAQYQATIDNLSELNDTLNDNNANILESIQKEIDLERQIRDNTDTEKELSDLEAQLAYLQRDTSNANEVEIRTLQKQLEESREDYSDTLIDQSIDRLQEANDAAAEQRERQIELMQAQLDYWQESGGLWGEVADLIAGGFTKEGSIIKGSDLWEVLKQADNWDALSESQKKNWANELILETNEVGAHLIQLSDGKAVSFQKVYDSIASANGKLTQEIKAAAETVRASIGSLKGKLGGTPGHSISATKGEGKGYASGGTATSTGLALLHGTPQEPEYVLNARQTDAFLRLADVLPAALGNINTTSSVYSGNATFNVEVNVGSISDNYDVDKLVARIKEDLYDAASYRNGNVLGFLR